MAGLDTSGIDKPKEKAGEKPPEDTLSLLSLVGQSALHAAIQDPLDGITQLVNQAAGHKVLPELHLVDKPPEAEFGSKAWLAETVGAGLGMVVPFVLTEGASSVLLLKTAAAATKIPKAMSLIRPLTMTAEEASKAGKYAEVMRFVAPAAKKALDGAVYGAVFTPSVDPEKDLWEQRRNSAIGSALTFGTMGLASEGIMAGAAKLKVPVGDPAFHATLKGVGFRLGANATGGAIGGFVSAESSSLLAGNGFATPEQIMQSMTSFLVTGAALDVVHMAKERVLPPKVHASEPVPEPISKKDGKDAASKETERDLQLEQAEQRYEEAEPVKITEGRHEVSSGSYEVSGDAHVVASGTAIIKASGRATVEAADSAYVKAIESASVKASGQCTVFARDNAQIEASDRANVVASGNAEVKLQGRAHASVCGQAFVSAKENATVNAAGRAQVTAMDQAVVEATDKSSIYAFGEAKVSLADNAQAMIYGRVTADAWGSSRVTARDHSRVIANDTATVDLFDRSHADATTSAIVTKHDPSVSVSGGGESRIYIPTLRLEKVEVEGNERKIPGITAAAKDGAYPESSPIAGTFKANHDAIVRLLVLKEGSKGLSDVGNGTGFFINENGMLATAYHVLEGSKGIEVMMPDGSRVSTTVVDVDPSSDLAILQVKTNAPVMKVVNLAPPSSAVEAGASALVLGHADGQSEIHASPGEVSRLVRAGDLKIDQMPSAESTMLDISARTEPGNSGSPVFDLNTGLVIGVASRGGPKAQRTLAIPTSRIHALLNSTPEAREARLAQFKESKSQPARPTDGPEHIARKKQESAPVDSVSEAAARSDALFLRALESGVLTEQQWNRILNDANRDARSAIEDIWIPARLKGNNSPELDAMLEQAIVEGGTPDVRRSMAACDFFYNKPDARAQFDGLDPAAQLRFANILSHLAAQRGATPSAAAHQIDFMEQWLLAKPGNKPTAQSLELFERTIDKLHQTNADMTRVFRNINQQLQNSRLSPLDAFGREALGELGKLGSNHTTTMGLIFNEFANLFKRKNSNGFTDSPLTVWQELQRKAVSDLNNSMRKGEGNKLAEHLLKTTDSELIEQLPEYDVKWLRNQLHEELREFLIDAGVREREITTFFNDVKSIADGRTGQKISKEFAQSLVDALKKQGLSSDEEIASAVLHLKDRAPYLTVSGLAEIVPAIESRLSLKGDLADFVEPSPRRAEMCPTINALVYAKDGEGLALAYNFHKSAQIHYKLYRIMSEPDGRVVLISPNGERAAISDANGTISGKKLSWDRSKERWEETGEEAAIPKLVLFENPQRKESDGQVDSHILSKISRLQEDSKLYIPEPLVGSLETQNGAQAQPGFAGGLNYLDMGRAGMDEAGMNALAARLAQQVHATQTKNFVKSDFEKAMRDPVREIEQAALTSEQVRTEALLLKILYESHTSNKPTVRAEKLQEFAQIYGRSVNYRTMPEFFDLSRQLQSKLLNGREGKDVVYIVLENEGSAFFIHEVYRKANGLDSSQFITEAEAKRLAQDGKLGGKRIVLLDDNFDFGKECFQKLDAVLDVSTKAREAGQPIDGATIASLFGFESSSVRDSQIQAYRTLELESTEQTGKRKKDRDRANDKLIQKAAENFPIDTVMAVEAAPLKDAPGIPDHMRTERCITSPGFPSGTNIFGAAEMWPHLLPNNSAVQLVELAAALGHFPTRVYSGYPLYRPLIDAFPHYFRSIAGKHLPLEERARLLMDAVDLSLIHQERGTSKPWTGGNHHQELRDQFYEARTLVSLLRSRLESGDVALLRPLVEIAEQCYSQVDSIRRAAVAELKAEEMLGELQKHFVTGRTQFTHELPGNGVTLKIGGNFVQVKELRLDCNHDSTRDPIELIGPDGQPLPDSSAIINELMFEFRSAYMAKYCSARNPEKAQLLSIYLDRIYELNQSPIDIYQPTDLSDRELVAA